MFLAFAMCLTLSAPAFAVEGKTTAKDTSDSTLTFEEYLEKYGEENVKAGFAAAEAEAMGREQALSTQNAEGTQNEGKSLFECLSEGEFLGLKVLGVTDIAPGEPGFMVCVEKAPGLSEAPEADAESTVMPMSMDTYAHYDLYYSTTKPDNPNIYYEPLAGAYFKKQSFSRGELYQCNTTVTFNNTELYCGTQANNAYIYLCAKSNAAVIDFGLMANPKANDRNRGLYAFYNASTEKDMWVEGFPKVQATSYGNSYMRLENKTVTIQLSVNRNTETVTMYMSSGGSMIFLYAETDFGYERSRYDIPASHVLCQLGKRCK